MARSSLIGVVEGKTYDARYLEGLCSTSPTLLAANILIFRVDSIADRHGGTTGGKPGVLQLFDYLKRRGALRTQKPTGSTSVMFLLDADVDHLTRRRRRSEHILYTSGYDAESDIIRNADLSKAMGLLTSFTTSEAAQLAGSLGDWVLRLGIVWHDWIALCCLAHALDSKCEVGYGRTSKVNNPQYGPADHNEVLSAKSRVVATRQNQSASVVRRTERKIVLVYKRQEHWRLVKGKWLSSYLLHETKKLARQPFVESGFEGSVVRCFLAALDFNGSWSQPARTQLEKLAT